VNDGDRYLNVVESSDEDRCYVGTSPGLFYGGCHEVDMAEVYAELCQFIDE
jgi:hypothetical protein